MICFGSTDEFARILQRSAARNIAVCLCEQARGQRAGVMCVCVLCVYACACVRVFCVCVLCECVCVRERKSERASERELERERVCEHAYTGKQGKLSQKYACAIYQKQSIFQSLHIYQNALYILMIHTHTHTHTYSHMHIESM